MARVVITNIWKASKSFYDDSCFDRAAAMSYYAFFSLIPLMLILTAILGFVFGTQAELLEKVLAMVRKAFPYIGERIMGDLRGLSNTWQTFGWLGVISFIWSAEFVLSSMAEALITIFGTKERYGFFRRRVINLAIFLMAAAAAVASIVITTAAKIMASTDHKLLGIDISHYFIQSFALRYVLPFMIVVAAVAVVYRMFAGRNLNMLYALYGSVVFTVLWEVAKQGFAWYIASFPSYNRFYASLGTMMILLLWIYFTSCIFLFSASYAKAAYDSHEGRTRPPIRLAARR